MGLPSWFGARSQKLLANRSGPRILADLPYNWGAQCRAFANKARTAAQLTVHPLSAGSVTGAWQLRQRTLTRAGIPAFRPMPPIYRTEWARRLSGVAKAKAGEFNLARTICGSRQAPARNLAAPPLRGEAGPAGRADGDGNDMLARRTREHAL